MFLDLRKLFIGEGGREPFDALLDCSGVEWGGAHPFGSVRAVGEVANNAGIVRIRYRLQASVKTLCDRCAQEAAFDLNEEFSHLLAQSSEEDDGVYPVDGEFRLCLDELVLSDLLLSMPAKLLCSPGCKGLCPQCGVNLNHETCHCTRPADDRFAVLKELLS